MLRGKIQYGLREHCDAADRGDAPEKLHQHDDRNGIAGTCRHERAGCFGVIVRSIISENTRFAYNAAIAISERITPKIRIQMLDKYAVLWYTV